MYRILDIALIVLRLAAKRSILLTPLQLLRIVYIIYVIVKASRSKKLFQGNIKEWKYSRMLPELWHAFKPFGASPVKGAISKKTKVSRSDINFIEFLFDRHIVTNLKKIKPSKMRPLIDKIKKELDL